MAKAPYSGRPLTSPGGLVQSGGYMTSQRAIDIKSRRFPAAPLKQSAVGGRGPKMPMGMD
jgi:hypothetical protein